MRHGTLNWICDLRPLRTKEILVEKRRQTCKQSPIILTKKMKLKCNQGSGTVWEWIFNYSNKSSPFISNNSSVGYISLMPPSSAAGGWDSHRYEEGKAVLPGWRVWAHWTDRGSQFINKCIHVRRFSRLFFKINYVLCFHYCWHGLTPVMWGKPFSIYVREFWLQIVLVFVESCLCSMLFIFQSYKEREII